MDRVVIRRLALLGILLLLPQTARADDFPEPGREAKKETPVAELIEQLKDSDYSKRFQTATELEKMGAKAESAIDALIDALGDGEGFNTSNWDFVYLKAHRTFLLIGPPAIPALTVARRAVVTTPGRR